MIFHGCATALITPFDGDKVDYRSLDRILEFQLEAGINALVICGTTGEPATMTESEKSEYVKYVIDKIDRRVPVIVGSGSNCTAAAIESSKEYEAMGADALLVVTPYYNKCTQKGLIAHYAAIAKEVNIPIFAYNVPPRTGVNILPTTYAELAKIEHVDAIKEACGNYELIAETARLTKGKMELYSGDDDMIVPFYPLGGCGVISVASNIIPKEMVALCKACETGDYTTANELAFKYSPIIKLMFCEVNPIPAKAAAALMGLCKPDIRLPLTPLEDDHMKALKAEMKALGLIS